MQQLNNLRDWSSLGEGEVLELKKKRHRAVKIHVNAADTARIYYQLPGESPKLLARVTGLETVAFNHQGEIDIVSDAPILYRTADNERTHAKPDGEKFTRIMERAPRNPEVEAIYQSMYANMDRRMRLQEREMRAAIDAAQRHDAAKIRALQDEIEQARSDYDDDNEEGAIDDAEEQSGEDPDQGDEPKSRPNRRTAGGPKRKPAKRKRSPGGNAKP